MTKQLLFMLGLLLITTIAISQPTIASFTPASGSVGTSVTITGANFSATAANNIVFFGATRATVTAATTTQLTVTVPVGATYNPITILVGGLVAYSSKSFVVTFANGAGIDATSLATNVDFNTGASPFGVAIGDLDGDGKADIAVTNYASHNISLFRNTSTIGAVSFVRVGFPTGTNPSVVSIGDLDGDGMADMAVTNSGSNTVSVFRNTSTIGTISYATKIDFVTGTTPYSVSIGDIDGDGKADLAVANLGSNNLSLFRNTSTIGTIAYAAKIDVAAATGPSSVSVGDIDGDIKSDIVVANSGANSVSVFRNTSTSGIFSFATRADFAAGSAPNSVSIGDLDNDGKTDIAVSNRLVNTVSVFRNTGTSGTVSFAAKIDFATNAGPYYVAIGDVDGDGKVDMATSNYASTTVSLFKNLSTSGTIAFSTNVDINLGAQPYSVAIGDLDGDGKSDLATANFNISRLSVFRNATKFNQTIAFGALTAKTFGNAAFALTATSSSGLPVTYASSNTSVATVAGNTVTIVGGGTTTITASQPGDANYAAATNVPQTLTVNKAAQTISFAPLPNKAFDAAAFNLAATASSGLPITYTSGNTTVATVSGSTVTIVGVGTTSITASQTGNLNFNAATVVFQNLTVVKADQIIVFGALAAKTFGDASFALTAGASSGQAISYTSSNTTVATIVGNTVTIVGAGTTNITASQAGNGNYNPATNVLQTLIVSKANQTITFGSLPSKTVGDAPFTLNATSSSGLAVSYTSSNTSVSTISGNTVTVVALGTTTITAAQNGDANFNPATNVQQILSVKQNQIISFGTLPDKTFGDAAFALTGTSSSSLTINFTSSNTAVAIISGSTITIVGVGVTTITASQAGDASYNPAADVDQTLTVNKANQTITFTSLTDKTIGESAFTLSVTASSGLPVAFSTTSNKITIASNQVTLVSAGRVTITAVQAGSGNFNAATSIDQSFCIKPATPVVTLSNANTASPTLTSSATVGNQWFRNGTAIAGATNPTISITQAGIYKVQVQVDDCISEFSTDQPFVTQSITFGALSDKVLGDTPFVLTGTTTSGLPLSYSTSSNKITIAGSLVSLSSAGRVTITASQSGAIGFLQAVSVDQSFCIKPAKPTISVSNTNTESPSLTSSSSSGNQWFRNGAIIAGATNAIYTVTQAGVYKVQVSVDDCLSEFSNDQAIIITGDLQKDANLVSVYPNPVSDWLTVRLGTSSSQKEVVIYQLGGKKMTSQKVSADEARFYVADYTQGVYVVRIITPDGVSVMRFMKQ